MRYYYQCLCYIINCCNSLFFSVVPISIHAAFDKVIFSLSQTVSVSLCYGHILSWYHKYWFSIWTNRNTCVNIFVSVWPNFVTNKKVDLLTKNQKLTKDLKLLIPLNDWPKESLILICVLLLPTYCLFVVLYLPIDLTYCKWDFLLRYMYLIISHGFLF